MQTHDDLIRLQQSALRLQAQIRRQTLDDSGRSRLRRFSAWEVAELILRLPQAQLRAAIAGDPALPRGQSEGEGSQRWFTFDDVTALRRALQLEPQRPAARAFRTAVANFKGGTGKSTVTLHLAQAAALAGYRVLLVDFDPQATLSHAMGITEADESRTVWGIIARDLMLETARMNAAPRGARSGRALPQRQLPEAITGPGLDLLGPADFIRPTAWSGIDIIPSCANAAFVEFASAQYRHLNPDWTFFAAVARFLGLVDDLEGDGGYDLMFFDCPPAIGYQAMNAVFAADRLYVPSGPGYWEYESTTSFLGQTGAALADLAQGFAQDFPSGGLALPRSFADIRILMTRMEPGNELHRAMRAGFAQVFGDALCRHAIESTRAVEQSGRFLASVYDIDYRDLTRGTWRRARATFDAAWEEFITTALPHWQRLARPDAGRKMHGQAHELASELAPKLPPELAPELAHGWAGSGEYGPKGEDGVTAADAATDAVPGAGAAP